MATSKCIKCDSTRFEVLENSPSRSNYKFIFVQCASCGGVVGVQDYFNVGSLLKGQEKTLSELEDTLSSVRSDISDIESALRKLERKV